MNDKNAKVGKYKYLFNNLALFSISNFVSKILVFLLVPFYTNVLSTADYGIADVMQTTLLLLVPALTINMGEAALRFGIDRSDKRSDILRIGIKYVTIAALIVLAGAAVTLPFVRGDIRVYLMLFVILFATNCTYEFMILFFQGCEQVRIVVVGSVLSTFVLLVSNILFLLVFRLGLNGYLFSQMIAYTLAVLIMLFIARYLCPEIYMRSADKDCEFEKELLDYGRPMIVYSTSSFINNAADRYLVALLKGVAVNGVYGVAYKIPAILTVFQRIFAQAWQMSATKSYEDEKSDEFFSTMYTIYNSFMVIGSAVLILLVRLVAAFLFRKDFYEAWRFVPPLLISVVFGALTGFLGSICLAHKDSRAMGIATGTGAVVNIVLNLILIPGYGAMGAAIATGISYFVMYFMAFNKVKRYVKLKVGLLRDYLAYVLLIVQAVIMIMGDAVLGSDVAVYVVSAVLVLVLLIMYFREAVKIADKFLERIRKK